MKKTLLIFVGLLLSVTSFALGKDSADAVIMLDYEQAWNDDTGRLSLRNNTNEPIEDLSFQITYIDMQGRTIGTENFNKDIYISPGETKTVDIPAFNADEHYSYYKSVAKKDSANIFIIRFDLTDYNEQGRLAAGGKSLQNNDTRSAVYHSDESLFKRLGPIAWLMLFVVLVGIELAFYIIVAIMAKQRNRNPIVWIVLSMFASPFLIAIILLIIGRAYTPDEDINHRR